jgi:hypothetical protein
MKTLLRSASVALLAIAVCAPSAGAETVKCQQAIAKGSSAFLQARVKALQKCNEAIVKNGTGTCPDSKASASITKAEGKLESTIGKACGGADKACGGDTTGEDLPVSVGWPGTCPDFENGHVCLDINIQNCGDIADCLECIAGAASDQAMTLYYGDLNLPSSSNKALNKCQKTIGKATSSFLNSKSKALQKCWDAVLKGNATAPCPAPGDGKAAAAIAKAETKKISAICKACGGADKACDATVVAVSAPPVVGSGGSDDLTPAAIGFAAQCPSVTVPGGSSCGQTITTLADLVECVDCVTEFKADCVDALQVPQSAAYPTECNACTEPPASGPCPTQLTFTADGPHVDLDSGFTGLAHDAHVPTNGRLTLNVSGCAGVSQPTCGQCNVSGPLDNPGGPAFANHRCRDGSWVQCSSDSDCTNAKECLNGTDNGAVCSSDPECAGSSCVGGTNANAICTDPSQCPGGTCTPATCVNAGLVGPCIFFFGSPLPLVAGGVSTCIVNEIVGAVGGTINLDDGTSTNNVPLASKVFPVGDEQGPCPHCNSGTCENGPRTNQACTITGHSDFFGDVSLDCPPNPGSLAGTLSINLNIATGTQSKTVTASNPQCRQTGYTGLKCLCDTCNNVGQDGCSTNADCPVSGGGPGICGGKRCIGGTQAGEPCATCIGGTNHGANCSNNSVCPGGTCSNPKHVCAGGANNLNPCSVNSECPGGTCAECEGGGACNRPGEATQPNSCLDDTSTPGLDCVDIGNNQGECAVGPQDQVCSLQIYHTCGIDADCQPGSLSCPNCLPGQTCISRKRPCFTDNGVIGNSVKVAGSPDIPCGGISKPTVGTFFCVAPVGASAVNAAGGLPALGRVRIPGIVDINP